MDSANDDLLRELLLERAEPIAIVGLALRFPGDNTTPEEFAAFLRAGKVGIGPVPTDRWDAHSMLAHEPGEKGKIKQTAGGYVHSLADFDPKFFNISPKEASYVDPQQRMVLECAWEALESANIDPSTLRGSDAGVYIGVGQMDYTVEVAQLDPTQLEGQAGPGIAHSAVCGRLSYFLGLRGPSLSVDTACSSSLVSVHLAITGLRRRETSIALCGGVCAINHPQNHIIFTQAGMLSPDGYCKTFDDRADGYGRSEGCGLLVLKRLSDAKRDGDEILALFRGSAVRQDGERGGLTVPNGVAQEALMRAALDAAMLEPGDVQYVEAHGTGTPLGDPIELGAIHQVFADSRPDGQPLLVASSKSNIGHMESAAGMGGVIKVVLQLHEGVVYPHANLQTLSRRIPWADYCVEIPTTVRPWTAERRRALVNSFGFAGTIASVVLEQAPPRKQEVPSSRDEEPIFTTSGKDQASLAAQIKRMRQFIAAHEDLSLADLCYTHNVGRAALPARFAVAVRSRDELLAALDEQSERLAANASPKGGFRDNGIAFLFTGQGAQYPGMGRDLYPRYVVFRETLDECDALFTPRLRRSIKALMFDDGPGRTDIHKTLYTQPALFSLEYAIARLWMSWGIEPTVLLGHSIGEVVAATIAGLFSLEDAVQLVAARARLMQSVTARGGMVAVRASVAMVAPLLEGFRDVAFACLNAPEQCVISGGEVSLANITERLTLAGVDTKVLPVSHAFHSPHMREVFEPFAAALAGICFHEPKRSFVSNLSGNIASLAEAGNVQYWVRHIGEPVNFVAGMQRVEERGKHVFIEVGPSPALIGMGKQCGDAARHLWTASLDKSDEQGRMIRRALAQVYMAGHAVSWADYHRDTPGRRVPLPTYAFDKRRYWLPVSLRGRVGSAPVAVPNRGLLGMEASSNEQRSRGEREFRASLAPNEPAYLADHIVMDQVVFPGAGYVEVLIELQDAVFGETSRVLRNVRIHEPLFLREGAPAEMRTRLRSTDDGRHAVEIVSRIAGRNDVIDRLHVTATFEPPRTDGLLLGSLMDDLARLDERAHTLVPTAKFEGADLYAQYVEIGLPYGSQFRRMQTIARFGETFVRGQLRGVEIGAAAFLHPAVLDCAMQTLAAAADLRGAAYLPVGFESIEFCKKPRGGELTTLLSLTTPEHPESELAANLAVFDGDRPVLLLRGLRLKRVANTSTAATRALHHELRWTKRSLLPSKATNSESRTIVVVHCDEAAFGTALPSLRRDGIELRFARDGADTWRLLEGATELCWFWQSLPALHGEPRLRAECEHNYRDLLEWVHLLETLDPGRGVKLRLVTAGAAWLPGDVVDDATGNNDDAAAASLSGFGRVLQNEYPALGVTLLDLPLGVNGPDVQPLVEEWLAPMGSANESEIAYHDGLRHVVRVVPQAFDVDDRNFELAITEYGQFANVKPVPIKDVSPTGDEITVRVRAAGLNFKDVLNALGMLHQHARDMGIEHKALPLGFEAAGTVIAAGPNAEFAVGDDVIVSQLGCMKRRATVSSSVAVRKPSGIGFAAAASLSAAYVTAHYALHALAHIKAGDRVLIHSAAGGVGQAAVQLAHAAGAEVYATASPHKWPLLHTQGVKHVMSSRTLEFSERVLAETQGAGVDIVLNSLNKDYILANVHCLTKHGRFVELGKIGVWTPAQMQAERPDVAYHNFDLSEFAPTEFNRLNKTILSAIVADIERGVLQPLPTVAYALDEVEEAFGVLSRGANVGKLAIDFGDPDANATASVPLSADEVYLVTGGLGALGKVTLDALVHEGARHLAILTRRPLPPEQIDELARELGEGIDVLALQGDVAKHEDVDRIMMTLAKQPHPLGGVIHGAGVLADAPIAKQSWESIDKVLAPKIYGTWNLHRAVVAIPSVRFFVTYSSIAAVLGPVGQSNYAAGNAFMDRLMQRRASRGLPGLSINWGPWAEVGMAASLKTAQIKSIESKGINFLKSEDGIRGMFAVMARKISQSMICEFDWNQYVQSLPLPSARFERLLSSDVAETQTLDLDLLLRQTKGDREAEIRALLRKKVARLLHFDSPEDVEPDATFVELGLDSLAVVELKNALETTFRIPISTSSLFNYPAIASLSEFIDGQLVVSFPSDASTP